VYVVSLPLSPSPPPSLSRSLTHSHSFFTATVVAMLWAVYIKAAVAGVQLLVYTHSLTHLLFLSFTHSHAFCRSTVLLSMVFLAPSLRCSRRCIRRLQQPVFS
jgi:hypothetical protein